jgi:hypothetical protein
MRLVSPTQRSCAFVVVAAVATTLGLLPVSGGPAFASHGNDGDPISEVPDLFSGGASFGTLHDHLDSTEPNGKGYGGGCDDHEGGSVYKFTAAIGTRVDLSVIDDFGGGNLGCFSLYRLHYAGKTLPGFYAFPDIDNYSLDGYPDYCPNTNSTCEATWTIPEDDTYYLAFWPGDGGSITAPVTFRFSVSIRQSTSAGLKITGHVGKIGGCFKARKGRSLLGTSVVSPASGGEVEFRLERRVASTGQWKLVNSFVRSLTNSLAKLTIRLFKVTRYRLRAEYLGDDGHAPSTSGWLCIRIPPPR